MIEFDSSELDKLAADLVRGAAKVTAESAVAVGKVAKETERAAQTAAPVDTGTLRASIHAAGAGLEWEVSADAPYAIFVEFGTYKDAPQPFLFPQVGKAERDLEDELGDIAEDVI